MARCVVAVSAIVAAAGAAGKSDAVDDAKWAHPAAWIALVLVGVLLLDVAEHILIGLWEGDERRGEVQALYWLSPLPVFLSYWIGVHSILAMVALTAALAFAGRRSFHLAGAGFGIAFAAMPELLLASPLVVLYGLRLGKVTDGSSQLFRWLGLVLACGLLLRLGLGTLLPAWSDHVGVALIRLEPFGGLGLPYDSKGTALLTPLVLTVILYVAWRARILDTKLLATMLSLSILAMVTLGGLSPALTLVALPLLSHHAAYAQTSGKILFGTFSALLGAWLLLSTSILMAGSVRDVALTAVIASGLVLFGQVLHRGVFRASVFVAHRKTMSIGIAGDSGAGKDTLVAGIAALFQPRLLARISGDDYHVWDRNKPMWRAVTHLNPKANDLSRFASHVIDLIDRRWVQARHYDHATGRMTKPHVIEPGEIVLVWGLHALWSPKLNELYDLRIFIDMDEDLRRFLKITRDVHERGHPLEHVVASIERRRPDAIAYIHPQRDAADLILLLEPRVEGAVTRARSADMIPLRLVVRAVPGIVLDDLARALVAICGIHAVVVGERSGASRLLVAGNPTVRDIAAVAARVAPEMSGLLRTDAGWQGGLRGVMQVLLLHQLEQLHRRRSVNA